MHFEQITQKQIIFIVFIGSSSRTFQVDRTVDRPCCFPILLSGMVTVRAIRSGPTPVQHWRKRHLARVYQQKTATRGPRLGLHFASRFGRFPYGGTTLLFSTFRIEVRPCEMGGPCLLYRFAHFHSRALRFAKRDFDWAN